MNYYGAGADKSGLYPGANYPGAGFGMPQQPGMPHGHQPVTGMAPGHPGMTHAIPQATGNQAFAPVVSTQSYSAFPGMPPGQSIYRTTGYSMPSGYPAGMSGSSGLGGMGSYYTSAYAATTLPYSTLQPIPQATPSIPTVASLPSVPAVPPIPSIQPSQSGYPASNRQYQLSQPYLSDPSKQPTYQIGSSPLMPGGVSPSSLQGVPQGYPAGSGMPLGYPSSAMTSNPYPGMPGVRLSQQTGSPPYGHGY